MTALIIIGGFAGAGKTELARRLSREFRLPHIATDRLNDILRPALGVDFATASPLVYDVAWSLVGDYLMNDTSVILEAPMHFARSWESLDKIKDDFPDVYTCPIILECSLETHKERVHHRGLTQPNHLNLGGKTFEEVLHKYEFIRSLDRSDLVRVSSEGSLEGVYTTVVALLRERAILV